MRALAFDIFRLTNGLILLALLMVPVEKLFALHRQKTVRPALASDIVYYYLTSLLPNRVLILPMAAVAFAAQHASPAFLQNWAAAVPVWIRIALSLIVAEIGFYWGHRWSHENAWLWRFHSIHHIPVAMDWLVNTHAHPVDLIFTRLCGYVPLYFLGLAHGARNTVDWVPLLVALVANIWGYFIHANVRLRFGWLENLIATPAFHHWHHDNVGPTHRHNNYSPVFPWVDRLFGTFQLDRQHWPGSYGIDGPEAHGLVGQLVQPFLPAEPAASTSAPLPTGAQNR
jgi:sterol desaturase/sphingolipid hydroxylase (fatty acid hydroxylase superfamily)